MKFKRQNRTVSCDIAYDFSGAGVILVTRSLDEDGEMDEEEGAIYMTVSEAREQAGLLLSFAKLAEERAAMSPRSSVFHCDNEAHANGTSLRGYIRASFAQLRELFGEPMGSSGDGKVSTEWHFVGQQGQVITLYDYKETKEYDDSPGMPTVEEFRSWPFHVWHVGAKHGADALAFVAWLTAQLNPGGEKT